MAHARRKFVQLHLANNSNIEVTAIELIGLLYGCERERKDTPAGATPAAPATSPIDRRQIEYLRDVLMRQPTHKASRIE